MFGWFEKRKDPVRHPEVAPDGPPPAEPLRVDSAAGTGNSDAPENLTSVPIMTEILKLLGRIEYGLDEGQIAGSLEISPAATLANCQALEQEMFIHHHGDLAQWFIAQRGLEFLQLPENRG